jgi:hypothetical protein
MAVREFLLIAVPARLWGSWYKLQGPRSPERGPEPVYYAHICAILGSYPYLSIVQINSFDQAQDMLPLTVSPI